MLCYQLRRIAGLPFFYYSLSAFALSLDSVMALSTTVGGGQRPSEYYTPFFEELPSMVGKSIVITGCSKGLGFVTAKALVEKGATVFMLNRKSEQSDEAQKQIISSAGSADFIQLPLIIHCDLLDFSSVRKAAAKIKEKTVSTGIDVLCNNAGIMLQPDVCSIDGYDITASTNVLSHFLLAKELFPELEKAASLRGEARIVNMSSASGYGPSPFNPQLFEKRGGRCGGSQMSYERYHQSKLGNLLFTSALDDRLQDNSKIKSLACTPGVCGTDMFIHATAVMNGGRPSPRNMVPSAEDGCMAQLKCICDPSVSSGDLWGPAMGGRRSGGELVKTPIEPPRILVDDKAKDSFWNVCEQAVGKFDI